ncbi:CHAT domain-containing protein [Accumulibacter sp.]|uniref:CHAT domain-containing protein n=1 Tax=Accumulibacter sp. TaxID=2053492 RepID=UPI0025DE011B|nr:CHAT domain-containing protein [Accumulibacter sp.]MCM8612545.1 CHAT domain-containing protein [Accumulibacter sp.]MCM8636424.1 CHAT domain-containing protein [Accumulibacter sp.]MCM8640144.1 CHAT domain-containing protein [Accumulibacter sp.]
MPSITILDLTATPQDQAPLPALLRNVRRATDAGDDPFMPPGYLQARACFELGATARGAAAVSQKFEVQADEVLVIELADGGVLITSASELQASLARSRPDLLGSQGEILFDRLRGDGAATRGLAADLVGGLISRVFALAVGASEDTIISDARAKLGELTRGRGSEAIELGVSWLGTKALMWAIEKRLERQPGIYCWQAVQGTAAAESDEQARARAQRELQVAAAAGEPVLVFVHGTGSSTRGSFGDLQLDERELWSILERQFDGRIYAFEHRTLSESPIENARQLLAALPAGLRLSLVTHSRGGLVGDLICLENFDSLIEHYRSDLPATGETDSAAAAVVQRELADAHGEQRQLLRALASELAEKKPVVQRYVRVASPAQGTRLASGNLDVFLSGLLTLLGQIPFFFGNPLYSACKRVVLEIARRRTSAHLVPGIEAMLPESPMARLLRDAPVRPGIEMAVIAGDIEGGGLLQRLGVLLTDFLLFDNLDNDLVVDTDSMYAGIAPQARARALFDRGAAVSHFAYFSNLDTRAALRDWLVSDDVGSLAAFQPLPGPFADAAMPPAGLRRGGEAAAADLPVVVVLPGVMGSHLQVGRRDRVWFDPLDIASGGLDKIAWGQPEVEAEELFGMFYGDLCRFLAASHRVECFAYDWRQPLDVLGERLAALLDRLLQETRQPIRLLAHSMGGLVVRACIHRRRPVMDALMARPGARLVMLGTPNQGAYSMVENLLGKGDTLRSLVRLDVRHDMREVLQLVCGFRGALQLLPKPGFVDCFQGQPDGGLNGQQLQRAETWQGYRPKVKDFWFGDGNSATPSQIELDEGSWLWRQDGDATPTLPKEYEQQSVYVFGVARNTPCGIREEKGRLKLVGTPQGDGTVTWASGRIENIGSYYYMPAQHGDLPSTSEYHPALAELLHSGATGALLRSPPAVRGDGEARPLVYDAGPPTLASGEAVAVGLLGGAPRNRVAPRSKRRLEVAVRAMDLRFLDLPVLLGHYEFDPISGAEALIDRELLAGDLGERYNLGLYAGPRGSATVVLRLPNAQERRRGSLRGAVVCGLGRYDGSLNIEDLTAAVRAGVLRYLLQAIDVLGDEDRDLPLATLLLGYNSSASVSVAASVEALVRGVIEANARFHEATRRHMRVSRVEIVELYQDTAITAAYALRRVPERLAGLLGRHGVALVCRPQLQQGEGWRRRLFDRSGSAYWPRLMITDDADRREPVVATPVAPAGGAVTPVEVAGRPLRATRTAVSDRLRFLYVGQRARAESIVHQRQPGLVEMLVRQQIHSTVWQESFGRALFQLMVPNDFKDAARQLERIVLVVDEYTANLPWELMFADSPGGGGEKLPLALRTPVVRQFATAEFRRQVRQGFERRAFVVGNPSVEGFARAFPDPRRPDASNPPPLPGAESEANEVAALLQAMGYQVLSAIGADWRACDVLTRLYQENHRLLHISAHGVFDQLHADGRRRSGVVLSDGLLLSAAEIRAMETVPELVFLSCCHLGRIDTAVAAATAPEATVRDGNLLAASVARELIDCGVRCVVVAGWAVDDQGALVFGNAFYRHLLVERLPFGEAVYEARKAVWRSNAQDITWGAFQAYGDPGWRAEPRLESGGNADADYASVEELLDELVSRRASLARASRQQTRREIDACATSLRRLLKERCPAGWLRLPSVQFAVGALWADLGQFAEARACYLDALRSDDDASEVPIGAIEQLANIEARLGEASADARLIERALARLADLEQVVAAAGGQQDAAAPATAGGERSALRGGAAKRLASLHATRLLAAWHESGERQAVDTAAVTAMDDALLDSVRSYAAGEGRPGERSFRPYHALNRLALQALLPDDGQRAAAIELAEHCRQGVAAGNAGDGGGWGAVVAAEALLVERLLDRQLLLAGEPGARAHEEVARAYGETLANLALRPRDLDSIVSQIGMLSRLCAARRVSTGDSGWQLAAERLGALAEHVWPGTGRRAADVAASPAAGDAPPRSRRPRRTRPAGDV